MNAVEFVKKFGLSEFKELYLASLYVDPFRPPNDKIIGIKKSEIKELFEAFELVEKFGGLSESRKYVDNRILPELSRAINLVEQCL